MRILRINMTDRTYKLEDFPEKYKYPRRPRAHLDPHSR